MADPIKLTAYQPGQWVKFTSWRFDPAKEVIGQIVEINPRESFDYVIHVSNEDDPYFRSAIRIIGVVSDSDAAWFELAGEVLE